MLSGSMSAKAVHRMLMKLTQELNFINGLRTAFMRADPKSIKKTVKLSFFLHYTLGGIIEH
jgi:hypothetical protein